MALTKQLFANNAKTTLSVAIAPADTTIQVVDASKFPTITTGQFFLLTIDNGSTIEVLKVTGASGNSFTAVRAQEGTIASSFSTGSKVENRLTANTIGSFLTTDSRFHEVASLDVLTSPITSNSNSYITHSLDDAGNPIMAIRLSDNLWRLTTHMRTAFSGAVGTGGSTSIVATNPVTGVQSLAAGVYVLQFTTGGNAGVCRLVTSVSVSTVSWVTALPLAAIAGDQFEIYKSTSAVMSALEALSSSGIIYSILLGD